MATPSQSSPLTKDLVLSILDFLVRQREDRENTPAASFLRAAVHCLERVYGVQLIDYRRDTQPLAEVVRRAVRPVPVRRRLEAAEARAEGNRLMARGTWAAAEKEYTRAVALDEYAAANFCNRAAAWIGLGKFRKAVADCSRAIVMDNRYMGED